MKRDKNGAAAAMTTQTKRWQQNSALATSRISSSSVSAKFILARDSIKEEEEEEKEEECQKQRQRSYFGYLWKNSQRGAVGCSQKEQKAKRCKKEAVKKKRERERDRTRAAAK